MELAFIENMRRRWEVLGIHTNEGKGKGKERETVSSTEGIRDEEMEDGDAEKMEVDAEEEGEDGEAARREIMQGAIVKSVISSAVKGESRPLVTTSPVPQSEISLTSAQLFLQFPYSPHSMTCSRPTRVLHPSKMLSSITFLPFCTSRSHPTRRRAGCPPPEVSHLTLRANRSSMRSRLLMSVSRVRSVDTANGKPSLLCMRSL